MKIIRIILTVVIIAALLVWGGMTLINNKKKSEEETRIVAEVNESVAVNVQQVKFENISTDYVANGTFEPFQQMVFPSEISGKVLKVLVDEGSYVRVGQTLAVIRGDTQSVDLTAAQAAYQNALTDNQRYENAFKTGGVTQQQVDMSRLNLKNAKAQLDHAKIKVGDTNVRATINGIVNVRYIEPGSYVSPGTQMFEIVNVSSLKLRVDVNENQVVNLKVGDNIKVKASVYPDKEFIGKITFIAPKATASLNFPVEIQVNNSAGNELKAGMYGTAIFGSSTDETQSKPVLVVPREAFVGGLNSNEVFVVNDSIARLVKITSGRNFGDKVEVLNGLQDGQTVVTSGHINLTDGSKVTIIK